MTLTNNQLGPYQIKDEIGRGGMAVIYRAVDTRKGETIALKVMLPHLAHEVETRRRFQQEGENAKRLIHPNIVRVYEANHIDGHYYIAMEYAAGGTLAGLLRTRSRPMSVNETLQILYRVAAALDYAHNRGILHRDIKLSNILIGTNNQILLSDFGIARQLGGDYTVVTATGHVVGTPAYMSPEQALGDETIDHRSDIYSLGVVAYAMLTQTLPFNATTPLVLLRKIIDVAPVPPEKINPQLPPGISYVLQRVLAKNPAQRYESAGEFVYALEAGITKTPTEQEWSALRPAIVAADPVPVIARQNVEAVMPKPSSEVVPLPSQMRRTRTGWPILAGGAGIIVFMLFAVQTWGGNFTSFLNVNSQLSAITVSPTAPQQSGMPSVNSATAQPDQLALVSSTVTPTATPIPATATDTPTAMPSATERVASTSTPGAANNLSSTTLLNNIAQKLTKVSNGIATTLKNSMPSSPVRAPTSTPVSDLPTATPTVTHTPTSTRTSISTPNYTPTNLPTHTPIPIAIATANSPNSNPPSDSVPEVSISLLAPNNGDTLDSKLTFTWSSSGPLPPGYAFEPIFWRAGEDPMQDGRGYGGTTTGTSVSVTTEVFRSSGEGEYYWGIRLVKKDPYEPVKYLGGQYLISVKYSSPNSGSDSPSGGDR